MHEPDPSLAVFYDLLWAVSGDGRVDYAEISEDMVNAAAEELVFWWPKLSAGCGLSFQTVAREMLQAALSAKSGA